VTSYYKHVDGNNRVFVDMYDISDPNHCPLLESKNLGTLADDVYVRDLVGEYPYLIIGCEKGPMLARIDHSDKIEIVDQFSDIKYYNYFYDGSYIYCFGSNNKVFSINKNDDELIFISDMTIQSGSVDRFGNYLYLALEDRGYVVYEITDPLSIANEHIKPQDDQLFSIYPNPFNNRTTITYEVERNTHIKISLFDITGKKVASLVDKMQTRGAYQIIWNAGNFASGTYLIIMEKEEKASMKKCLLLK
jgi:hypothetical protein